MKKWVILKNNKGIYSICNMDYLEYHMDHRDNIDDIIIKELDGHLTYEEASRIYIDFLDTIFPMNYN